VWHQQRTQCPPGMTTFRSCRHFQKETLACSLRTQQYADVTSTPTSTEAGSNESKCQSVFHP